MTVLEVMPETTLRELKRLLDFFLRVVGASVILCFGKVPVFFSFLDIV